MNGIDGGGMGAIDLNLLPALLALVEERSVTRAARRMGRTQSAMSHTLGRLRALIGDPLLVAGPGRALVPTPRAEALVEPLRRLLAEAGRLLAEEADFAPRATTRAFTLVCPDHLAPLLPSLAARMTAEAPRATLEVRWPDARAGEAQLEEGRADVALAPLPPSSSPGTPGIFVRRLGTISWCVVMRADHPAARRRRPLDLATWVASPHVAVRVGTATPSLVGRSLEAAGITRRVALVVPTFLAALTVVQRTDAFLAAPRELVAPLAAELGLRLVAPPVRIDDAPVGALWHERMHADAAHRWFRGLVVDELERALRRRR
jgi:DNA-binding transcriptional LysR family regulator